MARLADNARALPLFLAPLIAVIGLLATLFVIRTRWRVKKSLYSTLRAERTAQLEAQKKRATDPSYRLRHLPTPVRAVEDGSGESLLHAVAGYVSLSAALMTVLLGVLLAIGSQPR
jgi:hypothetical protein